MFSITVSRSEFTAHLKARIKVHEERVKLLTKHLKEIGALAKQIKADMAKAKRRASKVLRVKGKHYATIFAIGIAGERGPTGPTGCQGAQGFQGSVGYADFDNENQLLDKLESKDREFRSELDRLNRRIGQYKFYSTHLGFDVYNLNVDEVAQLEFTR